MNLIVVERMKKIGNKDGDYSHPSGFFRIFSGAVIS